MGTEYFSPDLFWYRCNLYCNPVWILIYFYLTKATTEQWPSLAQLYLVAIPALLLGFYTTIDLSGQTVELLYMYSTVSPRSQKNFLNLIIIVFHFYCSANNSFTKPSLIKFCMCCCVSHIAAKTHPKLSFCNSISKEHVQQWCIEIC